MLISSVDHPHDVLPPDLWRSLYTANVVLIDELITGLQELNDGVGIADLAITAWLPAAFLPRYDQLFLRRFLICLSTVGLKMRLPDFHPAGCVAEEIAAFATLECAQTLSPQRAQDDFAGWRRLALRKPGIETLYAADTDAAYGIIDADNSTFCFDCWFTPYSPTDVLHPYVSDAALPAWAAV